MIVDQRKIEIGDTVYYRFGPIIISGKVLRFRNEGREIKITGLAGWYTTSMYTKYSADLIKTNESSNPTINKIIKMNDKEKN